MVEALVCTQDWLRRATPINLSENREELTKLGEGNTSMAPCHFFFLLFSLMKKIFIASSFYFISELIQEFKAAKAGWLPPPTSSPNQQNPSTPKQARASPPSLHLYDHVS